MDVLRLNPKIILTKLDVGDFNRKFITTGETTQLRTTSMLGATGLLGYQVVKDMVAYVGAGVDYARWRYSEQEATSLALRTVSVSARWLVKIFS